MNKIAVSFQTKDRVELTKQSIEPLLDQPFDLFWCDGSNTIAGAGLHLDYTGVQYSPNIRGGAGAAYVFALTEMLKNPDYTHVGLVENDVLLDPGWFEPTMALFEQGKADGLPVGAATARTYVDRILVQRDNYAVLHNAGAGMVIFTREAARLALDHLRTARTLDNRRIFSCLSGIDIGSYWAFRGGDHRLVADWHWDAVLAAHGLATLGLTPSPCRMIGQNPPLQEQGLRISDKPVGERRNDMAFELYRMFLNAIRGNKLKLGFETQFEFDPALGIWTYFPHQMHMLGGRYEGGWAFKEVGGWGTFAWIAGENAKAVVPVFGNANVCVSGGKNGGAVKVTDAKSGYFVNPVLQPEGPETSMLMLSAPANNSYRKLTVEGEPGTCFYGIQTRDKQPIAPGNLWFDHSILPEPA